MSPAQKQVQEGDGLAARLATGAITSQSYHGQFGPSAVAIAT
ncbi:MAG TPA: hypothetical protein V6D19_07225 [Stenomitos sp.]